MEKLEEWFLKKGPEIPTVAQWVKHPIAAAQVAVEVKVLSSA